MLLAAMESGAATARLPARPHCRAPPASHPFARPPQPALPRAAAPAPGAAAAAGPTVGGRRGGGARGGGRGVGRCRRPAGGARLWGRPGCAAAALRVPAGGRLPPEAAGPGEPGTLDVKQASPGLRGAAATPGRRTADAAARPPRAAAGRPGARASTAADPPPAPPPPPPPPVRCAPVLPRPALAAPGERDQQPRHEPPGAPPCLSPCCSLTWLDSTCSFPPSQGGLPRNGLAPQSGGGVRARGRFQVLALPAKPPHCPAAVLAWPTRPTALP